ncbi:MAG: UDP-N-acetylmuramate dehydrogenase [Bacteroidetes bacterium]|nr:UDP-N-acetylmuramate dehydrogenase [Bacteroidota bacterium]
MKIHKDISLKNYNTFGIDMYANQFTEIASTDEICELISGKEFSNIPTLVLGGGSNILLTKKVVGLVLKISCKGIEVTGEDEQFRYLKAAAGENWHGLVTYCVERNFCGIENLSLIPGSVGAAPIQNIGAYGVELKDVFYELEAIHRFTGERRKFSAEECKFGYRDSVFKNDLKNQYIITSVTLALRKKPVFNTSYGDIEKELEVMEVKEINVKSISDAVCRIRRRKLPDPSVLGNAGSFFKNPTIANDYYTLLKRNFPDIPGYKSGDEQIKTSAGWLIDKCGWKGKRVGNCGVHNDHALVLVNYGGASGSEIYELSEKIKKSVIEMFGIELEREVNVIK